MSDLRREALVAAGRRAMADYLDRFETESEESANCFGASEYSAADRVASKILAL